MTKYFYILIFYLLVSCSFNSKSNFWTQEKKIDQSIKIVNNLFTKKNIDEKEFNSNINIQLKENYFNKNKINGNNQGIANIKLNFDKISNYNFSKIKYFDQFEPEIVFFKNDFIFFDNKGSIIRFGDKSKILWKKNFYSKKEKKLKPILNLSNVDNRLLVTDSLSKYYLVNIENGKLLWSKEHTSNFVSQIKVDKDRFYILDTNNTLICFSLEDGKVLWKFKSEKQLIKSQKKTSIIYDKNFIYYNNSNGEIISLDKKNGNLIWITPTISFDETFQSFLLKTSDIVLNQGSIYFSNNKNKFYSIEAQTGFVNWEQNINSYLRPILIDNVIFTISTSGYLYILDKNSGNIIRITDIFRNLKSSKREKIKISGFVVGKESIYISTNQGRLININIKDGKPQSIYKVSRDLISKPYVNDRNLYIIKDNEIIKLN